MVDGFLRRRRDDHVKVIGTNLQYIHRTRSLIDYILSMRDNGSIRIEGFLYKADIMEDAKWCNGDKWYAPLGGLYLGYAIDSYTKKRVSKKLKWVISQSSYKLIYLVNTLAISDVLREFGLNAYPRYLNDVFVDGKKIASVTVRFQNSGMGIDYIIVQIAININNSMRKVPQEWSHLKDIATSMTDIKKRMISSREINEITKRLIDNINCNFNILMSKKLEDGRAEIARLWMEKSGLMGKLVDVRTELGERYVGILKDIYGDQGAAILIEMDNKERLIIDAFKITPIVEKK